MNTQENNIFLLSEILDQYEAGTLDMTEMARKCYLSEKEKYFNKSVWIHNDELKNQVLLRKIGKSGGRDLLRQTREKL
jgi:hypothetical protein